MKACIASLLAACLLFSGTRETNSSSRVWDIKVHDINDVELSISNYGKIEDCCWPAGSNDDFIYGAGIWIGVRDSVASDSVDTLVTIGYGPHGGEFEFGPGLSGQDPLTDYVMIYMYPDPWPAPVDTFPMAPQDIVSEQDSWCCYNDSNPDYHMPNDTRPIGIEVYQTVYVWEEPDVMDIAFVKWDVKNVLDQTIKDCILGICTDCDIGDEAGTGANDICSGVVDQWYVVDGETIHVNNLAYQWEEEEEPGWSAHPVTIGFDLLQTPFDLVPGQDKDNDGIPDEYECDSAYYWNHVAQNLWDADNDNVPDWRDPSQWPQYGMTALKRFTLSLEPNLDNERYMTLAGYNFQTGQYEPYDTVPPLPDDQRFLIASGPFDLAPDSTATIIFAIMFAWWEGLYGAPDSALALIDKHAQEWYDMYWYLYTTVEEYSNQSISPSFSIMPNPVADRAYLQFNLMQPGRVSVILYDAAGRLVKYIVDEDRQAGSHTVFIHTDRLSSGTYFAVLNTNSRMETRSFVVLK